MKKPAFGNLDYFLSFEVLPDGRGPCTFAFNVQKVKEILEISNLNPLPPTYHPFVGLFDLRGVALPLLSLEFMLSDGKWTKEEAIRATERDWSKHKAIVLDLQGYFIGVIAGRMGRILDPKSTKYLPSPETMGMKKNGYINGMLKQDKKVFYLLDIEAILAELNGGLIEKSKIDAAQTPKFHGMRVLVVEDSALFRKKAQQLFSNFGFEVFVANDGEAALHMVRENPTKYDLIFTDIEMPIRNGVSFIKEVKTIPHAKEVPVIFNSSLSNEGLIRDIQQEGLGDYIIKYDEQKISEVLSSIFGSAKAA